jgi:ubiquinone/menaquinone biosynthesis C-methylase UbiE
MTTATDRLLSEQLDYYRARAPEYDQWWFRQGRYERASSGQWLEDIAEAADKLEAFRPRGRVLELACGTGIWTERLAAYTTQLTALDASAEVLALNATRLGSRQVRYVQADLFAWEPAERFDVVFFSFWLTHVPPERFEAFWRLVDRCLDPNGRVFFLDSRREPTSTAADHVLPDADAVITRRRLNDGRELQIYKVFYEPLALQERLQRLGWRFEVSETQRYFIYGSGRRAA